MKASVPGELDAPSGCSFQQAMSLYWNMRCYFSFLPLFHSLFLFSFFHTFNMMILLSSLIQCSRLNKSPIVLFWSADMPAIAFYCISVWPPASYPELKIKKWNMFFNRSRHVLHAPTGFNLAWTWSIKNVPPPFSWSMVLSVLACKQQLL